MEEYDPDDQDYENIGNNEQRNQENESESCLLYTSPSPRDPE